MENHICDLSEFRMERVNEYTIRFHIKGNRFLHRQVRAMVGTLFDIGRGRYPKGLFIRFLRIN
jgi:tRNA pseudouridine38-40 synthase